MRVLDLFSGMEGWSAPFKERGHEVLTLDNNRMFGADMQVDILETSASDFPWTPDLILASPPCESFSVAAMGKNWEGTKQTGIVPKSERAILGIAILRKTLSLIEELSPRWWYLENPCAAMRKTPEMFKRPRVTVTYCQYGLPYMKRTDIWGEWPDTWVPRPECTGHPRNGFTLMPNGMTFVNDVKGKPCHESASRGSRTGIQGLKNAAERGVIPRRLAIEVCLSVEAAMG